MSDTFSPLAPFVAELAKTSDLSPANREALFALPHSVRVFEPGAYLFREGERPAHCFAIVDGFACAQKIVRSGSRQITAIHMRGDGVHFGNALVGVADHGVQALTRVQAVQLPIPAVADLIASSFTIARAIWIRTLIDAAIQREWTANVGRRDARTRIAHLLCELGIRQEEAGVCARDQFDLPVTQEQLADATGLTPVHVNRVLGNLRADGLIGGRNRHVNVPDWDRLTAAADFRLDYLRCDVSISR